MPLSGSHRLQATAHELVSSPAKLYDEKSSANGCDTADEVPHVWEAAKNR